MDFYEKFYRPLLRSRVQSIVKSALSAAVSATEKEIASFLDASDAKWTGKAEKECPLRVLTAVSLSVSRSFWINEPGDNPLSLKQALSAKREDHRLLMKVKGYSESICAVCATFDRSTEAIYNDLNLYINSETAGEGLAASEVGAAEQEQIVAHLRQCSQDGIAE